MLSLQGVAVFSCHVFSRNLCFCPDVIPSSASLHAEHSSRGCDSTGLVELGVVARVRQVTTQTSQGACTFARKASGAGERCALMRVQDAVSRQIVEMAGYPRPARAARTRVGCTTYAAPFVGEASSPLRRRRLALHCLDS